MNKKFYKFIPLLKSILETLIIFSVSFFFDTNTSGEFIAKYYWMYSFGYFATGLLTIKHSGNSIKDDKGDGALILIMVCGLLVSAMISFFLNENKIAFFIIAMSSLLSIFDNTVFVSLEKVGLGDKMLVSSIYGRSVAILLILIMSNFFHYSIVAISICYLIKELINLLIFKKDFIKIIMSLSIKSFNKIYITLKENKSNFTYLFLASIYDPLSRFFIILNFDKSAVVFYEYVNRFPRIASISLLQISRYQLFTKVHYSQEKKFTDTFNYQNSIWFIFNLMCVYSILSAKLSADITTLIVILVTTFNLANSVSNYNLSIASKAISYLLFIVLLQILVSFILLSTLKSYSSAIQNTVFWNSFITCALLKLKWERIKN